MSSSLDFLYLLPPDQQNAILNGPALAPPRNDIVSNFQNPPNGNLLALVVTTIALVFVTTVVVLRAYAKIAITKRIQLQDYLAFLAYLSFVGYCYCLYRLAAGVGFLVHQWNVLVRDLDEVIFTFQLGVNFYALVIIFIKSSILLDWLRIFVPYGTRGAFFWTCHICIWFNALFYSAIEIAGNLSCRPFSRIWDKRIPGDCFDRKPLDLTSAGVNLVCDIAILLVPQKFIWHLHLTTAKKIGVSIIFAIGLLATASATGRLVATEQYLISQDTSYEISRIGLWGLAELSFGFLVLCIPNLPGIFKRPNVLGRRMKSILPSSLYSQICGMNTGQDIQTDDRDYDQMQSNQVSLVNLPAQQTTYQISSATGLAHLHDTQNNGPLANHKGAITLTKEFTAHATRLIQPSEIEHDSLYHTWQSNRGQGLQYES
ncbi:hypothetical protein ANO14919_104250 [Xylariales sp. No.14919]|nr:hypothetical protein ANO14919_104250 [Xylariales sp. No.14919]